MICLHCISYKEIEFLKQIFFFELAIFQNLTHLKAKANKSWAPEYVGTYILLVYQVARYHWSKNFTLKVGSKNDWHLILNLFRGLNTWCHSNSVSFKSHSIRVTFKICAVLGAQGIRATGFKRAQGNAHCAKFESHTNRVTFETNAIRMTSNVQALRVFGSKSLHYFN